MGHWLVSLFNIILGKGGVKEGQSGSDGQD